MGMTAIDPGGVPTEPDWQLPIEQLQAATSVEQALRLLAPDAAPNTAVSTVSTVSTVSADRIAAAVSVLPTGPVAAGLIEACDPADPTISPLGRLRLITATEQHTSRMQARQDQWLASFARPGIAAPIDQLLTMACDGRRSAAIAPWVAEPIPLDVRLDPETFAAAVADLPQWQAALEQGAERAAANEVAAVLGISPQSAQHRIRQAVLLIDDFPSTLEAQLSGRLDRYRSRTITNTFRLLQEPELRATTEHQAIADSDRFTPGTFTDHCEHLLMLADPDTADYRAKEALAGRKTRRHCGIDGVGRFTADLPADKVLLTAAVLDAAARRFPTNLRDGRTTDQLRADIFASIFTDLAQHGHVDLRGHVPDTPPEPATSDTDAADRADPGDQDGTGDQDWTEVLAPQPIPGSDRTADPPPPVFTPWSACTALTVTIAASTLAGLDNDPGQLAGHGWIHADLARQLAESAASIRLAINREDHDPCDTCAPKQSPPGDGSGRDRRTDDPGCQHQHCHHDATCGGTLDHGRAVYRPRTATADYVTTRDRTCRFIGCIKPADGCDLDHRTPFQAGGPTCPCNLDTLCRAHHRSKTFLGWTAVRLPGNHLQWTTPHGYTATDHPELLSHGKHFTPTDLARQLVEDPPPF